MQENTRRIELKLKSKSKNKRKGSAKEIANNEESKKSNSDKIEPIIRNEKFEKYSRYFTEGFSYTYSSKIESCFRCSEAKDGGRIVYLKENSIIICKDCYKELIKAKHPSVSKYKSFNKYKRLFRPGLSDPYPHVIESCRRCACTKLGGRIVHLKDESIIICNDCYKALDKAAKSLRKRKEKKEKNRGGEKEGGGSSIWPIYTPMRG